MSKKGKGRGNFKMRKENGITLVALIITIVVMLILVAVSINVLVNSNLIDHAEKTGDAYAGAIKNEENFGNDGITVNGKDFSNYIPLTEIKAGERASETSKYQTAVIPKGFTVSNATGEKNVSTGLVIYDIPEGATVDWNNKTIKLPNESEIKEIKTAVNQFVWIPVEVNRTTEPKDTETSIASFYRSKWSNNERTTVLSTDYTEPYTDSSGNDYDSSTGIKKQIEDLTKSIYKYGGFYVGRYEAGSVEERTSSTTEVTTIGIKQDMYPYNYVKWGDSISDIGTEGAVYLSNSLYNSTKPNYGATSMLCTGACWDSMLDFIKDEEHNVTSSTNWGNYSDSNYVINRGKYAVYSNGRLGKFQNVNNKYPKAKDTKILLTTGSTEKNSAKNIYDVAGNCREWTTESYSSGNRVNRGRQLQQQWFFHSS